tara:strand:+ start:1004 stop:1117 length:114 start_codon:yes stop_codon:yes gene_type:complete
MHDRKAGLIFGVIFIALLTSPAVSGANLVESSAMLKK